MSFSSRSSFVAESSKAASRNAVLVSSSTSHLSSESSQALRSASIAMLRKTQDTSFVQVQRKLRKHPDYKDLNGDALNAKVIKLIDVDAILETFSHLVERKLRQECEKMVLDKLDLEQSDSVNAMEAQEAKAREKNRYIQVATIPLKITVTDIQNVPQNVLSFLCPIGNFLVTDYGTKHVSLTVGNVVIQWGAEHLVIPEIEEEGEIALPDNDVQVLDITKHCPHNIEADRKAPREDLPLKTSEEEMEHLIQRVSVQKPIFQKLAELISKYNTKYYYHPLSRNCQGFVRDALKVFGFSTKPPSPKISPLMQEVKSKKDSRIPASFAKHEDLDAFIQKSCTTWLERLDADSMEYLQHCYMHFHGDVACHLPTCQAPVLNDVLKQRLEVA